MSHRAICMLLLAIITTVWCLAIDSGQLMYGLEAPAPKSGEAQGNASLGPLKELANTFPDSIHIRNHGRLLEFCPDGTCDGFVVSGTMATSTLEDFGYLYEYYFSDYTFLDEWRASMQAKNTAESVLSKPDYSGCKSVVEREVARCVLLNLSHGGRVRLIFVRYDEGERNVVPINLAGQLAEKKR